MNAGGDMPSATESRFSMRVFISSTFSDLEVYRQATFQAIQSLGAHGDDMIQWSADERDAASHSLDRVRQCDILILLLAHRYGYVAPGSPFSITEMEYRAARDAAIPVLAYFIDESEAWPPNQIEWQKVEQLRAFKQRVESEVTRKTFRSPDELGRLVTQALALFIERHRDETTRSRRYDGSTLLVDAVTGLKNQPDTNVHIGRSEEGLPLVLGVHRSRDFRPQMESLGAAMADAGSSATALLSSFRQSLEAHAKEAWAGEGFVPVSLEDGSSRKLYVTKSNLSQLFRSALATILAAARRSDGSENLQPAHDPDRWASAIQVQTVIDPSIPNAGALESEGGTNRFLGIDPLTNDIFSVGWRKDQGCVAWRPFVFESIAGSLPSVTFVLGTDRLASPLTELPTVLLERARQGDSTASAFDERIALRIPRQDVLMLLSEIARQVANLHARGIVHGDLKPHNVLLGRQGPELIDAFKISEGSVSPGWTPNWSAPEQILGEAVTAACDLYPIGKMIADVLGGELVGEVRKFKARPGNGELSEFDIFYNPSIHLRWQANKRNAKALAQWAALARQCLRFSPADRPASAAVLAQRMNELAVAYPLTGEIRLSLGGELHVATLPDGSQAVARLIGTAQQPAASTPSRERTHHSGDDLPQDDELPPWGAGTTRSCPKGHPMAVDWDRCPYCEAVANAARRAPRS